MNRDEIDALEPGPEMDAAVAENVMGLDVVINPESAMCNGCKIKGQGAWVIIERDYSEWGHKVERPGRYSTDWNDMELVIEEM